MHNIDHLYSSFLQCTGVVIDSRKASLGSMFFALKGNHTDGNRFAATALESGAKYAVIDNPDFDTKDGRCIVAPDVLDALQTLARHHRKHCKIPFIGITGSNGKTTTKELVAAVLATTYQTYATQGNLNNHIGVPLTLLAVTPQTQMAVIEMGANKQGDINELCSFALPNFGLITGIGKAHLEGFGGIEGVKKGKGELFEFLDAIEGRAFVNFNDFRVAELAYFLQKATTYGNTKRAKIFVEPLSCNPFLSVRWHLPKTLKQDLETDFLDINTQLTGAYNLDNVTAAIAIGAHFKVDPFNIARAIEGYVPQNNRSQMVQIGSNTLILDAYNANPTSMQNALQNFTQLAATNKVVILGDMLEMGEFSTQEHSAVLEILQNMPLQLAVLIGTEFEKVKIRQNNFLYFPDAQAAKQWYAQQHLQNTHILLKGSRGMALETIFQ